MPRAGGIRELRNRPRHPRYVRELMSAEGKMIPIDGELALLRLTADCKMPEAQARRVLNIAWEFGQKAEPIPGGYVHVWYHGQDDSGHVFSVIEHLGPSARKEVLAGIDETEYTHRRQTTASGGSRAEKGKKMARTAAADTKPATRGRGRTRPAPEPDPEPTSNGALDVDRFLTKPFTATMQDYVEWFETEVTPLADLRRDLPRILVLGVQLYGPYFQKSDFNVERREARRAERASAAAPEPEPATTRTRGRRPAAAATEPAKPASRGRGRTAAAKDEPAPATSAPRRGRPPGSGTKASTAKAAPASGRGRGRPAKAAASKDSPF